MITVNIGGVTYPNEQSKITYCRTYHALFGKNTLSAGGVVSGQIDLSIYNPSEIPRGAKIELFEDGSPRGVFWTDTRETDDFGVLTLHGYDAMLKAEDVFLREGDVGEWPRSSVVVVNEIASRMGVELDPSTVIEPYMVEYPNDYTMRELLSYVAASQAANWIVTPEGKLLLIGLNTLPPDTNYLITNDGEPIIFGEVLLIV